MIFPRFRDGNSNRTFEISARQVDEGTRKLAERRRSVRTTKSRAANPKIACSREPLGRNQLNGPIIRLRGTTRTITHFARDSFYIPFSGSRHIDFDGDGRAEFTVDNGRMLCTADVPTSACSTYYMIGSRRERDSHPRYGFTVPRTPSYTECSPARW